MSFWQVENLNYKDLLAQLKAKGQRQPDYTRALIKEKLADQDQEIATTSCKVERRVSFVKPRKATTTITTHSSHATVGLVPCSVMFKQATPQSHTMRGHLLERPIGATFSVACCKTTQWSPLCALKTVSS